MVKRILILIVTVISLPGIARPQANSKQTANIYSKYGHNSASGQSFYHDGVRLYYETYGTGEPVLMVHGNGGSISDFAAQIAYFRQRYKVIAMDSRDQGLSGDSPDKLTYEKMADDLAALLDHLKLGPVNVLGWSDGGIEALLLGMRHPAKVKKLIAMAANLTPSEDAFAPGIITSIKQWIDAVPAAKRNTSQGRRELKVLRLTLEEPHIDVSALEAIRAPTLILASDHDAIRDEHTIEIFHHIPSSQLAIFPNATHMIPFDDPASFNATVERFLRTPFVRKDRLRDMLQSIQKLEALEHPQ